MSAEAKTNEVQSENIFPATLAESKPFHMAIKDGIAFVCFNLEFARDVSMNHIADSKISGELHLGFRPPHLAPDDETVFLWCILDGPAFKGSHIAAKVVVIYSAFRSKGLKLDDLMDDLTEFELKCVVVQEMLLEEPNRDAQLRTLEFAKAMAPKEGSSISSVTIQAGDGEPVVLTAEMGRKAEAAIKRIERKGAKA
jgi:hypothetical protein